MAIIAVGLVGWWTGPWLNGLIGWTFRIFNRGFDWSTGIYVLIVGGLLRVSLIVLFLYGGLLVLTYQTFVTAPKGFIPVSRQGISTRQCTNCPIRPRWSGPYATMHTIEQVAAKVPG